MDTFGNRVHNNRKSKLNLSSPNDVLIIGGGKSKLVCHHHCLLHGFHIGMSWFIGYWSFLTDLFIKMHPVREASHHRSPLVIALVSVARSTVWCGVYSYLLPLGQWVGKWQTSKTHRACHLQCNAKMTGNGHGSANPTLRWSVLSPKSLVPVIYIGAQCSWWHILVLCVWPMRVHICDQSLISNLISCWAYLKSLLKLFTEGIRPTVSRINHWVDGRPRQKTDAFVDVT